ncbi:hypothetical protein DL89DRAFT_180029 [Linderina pennispora]|uniref:Uncharacterized protein n=1 Tax=Linderina pennispora TaxID=61395 RepID=A0A1Y1W5R9_9FUNG|nr:uncharacterized protein DL89DRAFT_180029 [Linderina pennispora]ORX68576.1 hypothetical protein DL89DRAFT_180029 [Linderina pennispora]
MDMKTGARTSWPRHPGDTAWHQRLQQQWRSCWLFVLSGTQGLRKAKQRGRDEQKTDADAASVRVSEGMRGNINISDTHSPQQSQCGGRRCHCGRRGQSCLFPAQAGARRVTDRVGRGKKRSSRHRERKGKHRRNPSIPFVDRSSCEEENNPHRGDSEKATSTLVRLGRPAICWKEGVSDFCY